ncbi:MAG: 50S ribosomal protein L25 [Candidatus Shikimatogenerans sp. Ttur]|uniref:50S ribosomal protein L25 n=1 Tax=Candidatus Shikimatogenerans sp. Ttur TaxID=3158569 RepID=A0AAU7ZY60_9FLAO
MKKKIKIKAKKRIIGKLFTYKLRKANKIICNLYNKYIKNLYFYIKDNIKYYYYNKYKFFNIIYKKKKYLSIIKEIQFHPINNKIIHIDFLHFKKNDIIITYINIKFIGKSIGVIKGGILEILIKKIKIKSNYNNIPNNIIINITKLKINDKIFIKDINNNNKFIILNNNNNLICFIKNIRKNKLLSNKDNEIKNKKN